METMSHTKSAHELVEVTQSLLRSQNHQEENGSVETLTAGGEEKKFEESPRSKTKEKKNNLHQHQQPHSTPTSTFDDGYGSCNSTPQGSGKYLSVNCWINN